MSSIPCEIVPGELYRLRLESDYVKAASLPRRACNYGFIDPAVISPTDDDDVDVFVDQIVLCIAVKPCECVKTGWKKEHHVVHVMLTQNGIVETHSSNSWVKA